MQKKLYSILTDLASDLGAKDVNFKIEVPKEKNHGDLASNIALVISQNSKFKGQNSSKEVAEEIVRLLTADDKLTKDIEKVEVAGPGFINFYFSQKYLTSQLTKIVEEKEKYGSLDVGEGKKVSVEYVSANPTGPLHIGNARGGPLGDIIANVLERAGYQVTREYLHNNVGGQVEKLGETIYYTLNPKEKPQDLELQYQGEYIKELAKQVQDQSKELNPQKAGELAVEIMFNEILEDCKMMGITFDKVTKESDLRKEVPQVLPKLKNSLKNQDGALWFAPKDEFLKDRETVVKKSNGDFTYFASDIAYHNNKLASNDLVVDILGSNHSGHVPRLFAVINALGYSPNNFRVILYQYVRLKGEGRILKMSKREGNFVKVREVLNEVGKDAFRFFMAMQNSNSHIDFDLDLAKKKANENPVFYVQYAYTRICSIFEKADDLDSKSKDLNLLKEKEELDLVRKLLEFPNLVENVAENFAINLLTTYAMELASAFHAFYEKHQVLSSNSDVKEARLFLLKATQITLKNTLDLLGVSAPEKM